MRRSAGLALLLVPPRVEASLWRRLRFERDGGCREQLFVRYRPLARSIARRQFARRPRHATQLGDVEHFAYEGLLQAIDRYDPLRDIPFGAFARRRIAGSIADGTARMDEGSAFHHHQRRKERERLQSLAANPAGDPVAELAALASGLAIGLILEGTGMVASADSPDPRPNAYQTLAWRELAALLAREIDRLPTREAFILRQHYEAGVSFTQVAAILGITKGRVSQLHAGAIGRLRCRLSYR